MWVVTFWIGWARYKDIFVNPNAKEGKSRSAPTTPKSSKAAASREAKPAAASSAAASTPQRSHQVRIRRQASPIGVAAVSVAAATPTTAAYACDLCDFKATRINVLICHRKTCVAVAPPSSSTTASTPASTGAKGGRKRAAPASSKSAPASASNGKRRKKADEPGDLFDQVKRNLENNPKVRLLSARSDLISPGIFSWFLLIYLLFFSRNSSSSEITIFSYESPKRVVYWQYQQLDRHCSPG